jgi:hypothetical protein
MQAALWAFCAEIRLDICNGRRIDDSKPCGLTDCPVGHLCSRKPLKPAPQAETSDQQPAASAGEGRNTLLPTKPAGDVALGRVRDDRSKTRRAGRRRKTAPNRLPAPYQQGELDGLCGLYTIVNAIRLALQPHGGLSDDQAEVLFESLIRVIDDRWELASIMTNGLGDRQFTILLNTSLGIAQGITGKRLVQRRKELSRARNSKGRIRSTLRSLTRNSSGAVILGISGGISHWSVLSKVTERYIHFYDSDRHNRVAIDSCRLGDPRQTRVRTRLSYRLHLSSFIGCR